MPHISSQMLSTDDDAAQRLIDSEIAFFEAKILALKTHNTTILIPHIPSQTSSTDIDSEIASFEAQILALKTRRNAHSPISKLPVELLTDIFLLAKFTWHTAGQRRKERRDNGRDCLNVAGVCRRRREIALVIPRMWNTLDISRIGIDTALDFLARSQSTPLWVHSRARLYKDAHHRATADAVMSQIARIQSIDISASHYDFVGFMELNASESAPLLQSLRLASVYRRSSLPNAIFSRGMPSLRNLELVNCDLSYILPPLTSLSRLKIISWKGNTSSQAMSLLLMSLQNTRNLEELVIINTTHWPTSLAVELPKLSRFIISSEYVESSSAFQCISHPSSTRLQFSCTSPYEISDEEISAFVRNCFHFPTSDLSRESVAMDVKDYSQFQIRAGPLYLSFSSFDSRFAIRVFNIIPLWNVETLRISGLKIAEMHWVEFLIKFEQVQTISATDINREFLTALSKFSGERLPLPKLRRLTLKGLVFDSACKGDDGKARSMFIKFIAERVHLGISLELLEIQSCSISRSTVEELMAYVDVDWDGDEPSQETSGSIQRLGGGKSR